MSLPVLAMPCSAFLYIRSTTILRLSACFGILIYRFGQLRHIWVCFYWMVLFLIMGCISLFSCISGHLKLDSRHCEFYLVEWQIFLYSIRNSRVFFWAADKSLGNSSILEELPLKLCQLEPQQLRVYLSPLLRQSPSEHCAQCPVKFEAFPLWLVRTQTAPGLCELQRLFACLFSTSFPGLR